MRSKIRWTIVVALTLMVTLCIQQYKQPAIEEVQPELSEEGFIDLVNTILVEKVSLDMFDISEGGGSTYIRNTYDHSGKEIHVSIHRYVTEIHISVIPGHFAGIPQVPAEGLSSPTVEPHTPEMVDARGLLTPQIENQVDLTPPSDFGKCRKYTIVIMTYKGTLDVCRGDVSIHFRNIGAYSPTPTPPGPISFISKVLYYGFIALFVLVIVLAGYGIVVLRRRKKL